MTFDIQPLLRRSRFLVSGPDLDINEERSFYTESMSEIVELDPAATERRPITLWIVDNKPFTRLGCAEAAAAVEAMLTRHSVPIEKVVIPSDIARKLVRAVPAEELLQQRLSEVYADPDISVALKVSRKLRHAMLKPL
ncbi:hypothetical protein [Schlesneria sp. T3-172]|uniref:hypothetical protein n=1 Tax=Schlesneria sphaerica TaxID=3373610 RepID=UPI0037C99CA0